MWVPFCFCWLRAFECPSWHGRRFGLCARLAAAVRGIRLGQRRRQDAGRQTTTVCLGYIGIMEKKMETTTTGHIGFRVIWGLYRDNGKEHGNYYSILGLYRDNQKENGNYRDSRNHLGVI